MLYNQGDIIIIRYPLSDKPEKSIIRTVIIVSNKYSNSQDKDILVCQITKKLRNNDFSYLPTVDVLTVPMPQICEVRCNKIATIRTWDEIIHDKITEVNSKALADIISKIKFSFKC